MDRRVPLVALELALAACGTTRPFRGEEGAPKAVVLCPPERREDAETLARALNSSIGYDVRVKVTPLPRARSSAAIYGLHDSPERADEVLTVLRELGTDTGEGAVEVLPFQQHATGGNAVVVWLASAKPDPK